MNETQQSCYDCKFWQEWTPKVRDDGMTPRGQCNNLRVTLGAHIPRHGGIACKHTEFLDASLLPHQEGEGDRK